MATTVDDLRSQLVERILEDVQTKQNWVAGWTAHGGPVNACTGSRYRGLNVLHLLASALYHGYADPRWVTYNQAKKMGAQVRKGDHGTKVEKWGPVWKSRSNPDARIKQPRDQATRDLYAADPDKHEIWVVQGTWTVFNASQVDGIEPYVAPEAPWDVPGSLSELVTRASPCPVVEGPVQAPCYVPLQDRVHVPPKDWFHNEAAFAGTMLHEQGHAKGHESRPGRTMGSPFGSPEYAKEELRAELCSLLTAVELGVELTASPDMGPGTAVWTQHAAYLRDWAQRTPHADAVAAVKEALPDATRASRYLVDKCYQPALQELAAERAREMEQEQAQARTVPTLEGARANAAAVRAAERTPREERRDDRARQER